MIGIGIEVMTAEIEHVQRARRADRLGVLRTGEGTKRRRTPVLLAALVKRLTDIGRPRPSIPAPARPARPAAWCGRAALREETASARRPGRWRECETARRADRAAPSVPRPAAEETAG